MRQVARDKDAYKLVNKRLIGKVAKFRFFSTDNGYFGRVIAIHEGRSTKTVELRIMTVSKIGKSVRVEEEDVTSFTLHDMVKMTLTRY